ncbi:UDP-2,3-diacylglucosamine diphosphatase [Azospirillum sp. RWY-5-1]|uniref:UDP-2,3-diacylglucosamine diphosphatase n=1 Tax=Azospirillum oleiclasticum TaxID=2735135 RepID=A0ABX2T6S6_9PROT|nr:UDP-2,3-diacylglucosamine diphosphatase [Azospirillum oleiclasticum]NYZ12335.1 UDP-2,3-diacylglucosamine diphosphatase [Azospirillum oleiclasticum]NYZ19495.1 UDP-2,3-diacylglucosamine diphosphatase [Azospirillum oleiclasticum]
MSTSPDRRYRTVWISDVHLGTRGCQAARLLDFLRECEAETLYLVGDIVDVWRLRRRRFWPQEHSDVVQKLLRKARRGTRVILVPGNHDDVLHDYVGLEFGQILIKPDHIHETADGRRLLVIHGDQFDTVVARAPWLAHLGTHALAVSQLVNQWFNWWRRVFGYPYWSLSGYLKHKVKHRAAFIAKFDAALVLEAERRGVDGVVCGHIHHPEIRQIGAITYYNDGDWVDSCTALVEDENGQLELIRWPEPSRRAAPEPETEPATGVAARLKRLRRLVPTA